MRCNFDGSQLETLIDDLEPDHDQHANRYCYRCGEIFIRAGGVGTINRSATSSYGDLLAAQRNVTGIAYAGINSEEN